MKDELFWLAALCIAVFLIWCAMSAYFLFYKEVPPSSVSVWPVMNPVASEASQTMASAISDAFPKRLIGICPFRICSISGRTDKTLSNKGDSV